MKQKTGLFIVVVSLALVSILATGLSSRNLRPFRSIVQAQETVVPWYTVVEPEGPVINIDKIEIEAEEISLQRAAVIVNFDSEKKPLFNGFFSAVGKATVATIICAVLGLFALGAVVRQMIRNYHSWEPQE